MELRALRYFVAVAEELHFGRAAHRLHVSQPPLSRQIKNLETELGCVLLRRTKRRVELTATGKIFLRQVVSVLSGLDEAAAAARRAQRGEIGRLVVGFFLGATYTLLPRVLHRFRARAADVELVLRELPLREIPQALAERTIDVAFLRPPLADPLIASEVLSREPYVAAVPSSNRLARRRQITIADLAREPFVMFDPGPSVVYSQIMNACYEAGFHPRVVQEARRPETLVGLVRAGIGVALLPASVQPRAGAGIAFKTLSGEVPLAEIAVAWRRDDDNPLLEPFLNAARLASEATGGKNVKGQSELARLCRTVNQATC